MIIDLAPKYRNMADDDLLRGIHWQPFRPDAKELAKGILLERGLSEEAIRQWRDPNAEIVPPCWSEGVSTSELQKTFSQRQRVYTISLFTLVFSIALSVYLRELLVVMAYITRIPEFKFLKGVVILLFCFKILSYAISIGCCLFHFLFHPNSWRTPLRILLLRPFEFPQNRKKIKRFARRYLRHFGHTYTISDTVIRRKRAFLESLQFVLPYVVSGWFYGVFRPYINIYWDEDVSKLWSFMGNRVARNIAWALSWDKLFKISCTPVTWKHTIQHLINSVQVIVVDLSNIGDGLIWELNEVQFYGATGKRIFITHESCVNSARSFLESYGMSPCNTEIFVYGDDGRAVRHEELFSALASAAAWSSRGEARNVMFTWS